MNLQINFGDFLRRRAFITPHIEATVEPAPNNRRLDFRELNARSNRVAQALKASAVMPGDRVALLLMNGAEFIETFFAIAKIGAVNVPLNWRLVADELEFILDDCGATVLVYSVSSRRWPPSCGAAARETDLRLVRAGGRRRPRLRLALRRLDGRGARRRTGVGRLRRRPAVHHVHLGHHRPAEGRDAHPRHGDVGDAHTVAPPPTCATATGS